METLLKNILSELDFKVENLKISFSKHREDTCLFCENKNTPHVCTLSCGHQCCTKCLDENTDNWEGDGLFSCKKCGKIVNNFEYV